MFHLISKLAILITIFSISASAQSGKEEIRNIDVKSRVAELSAKEAIAITTTQSGDRPGVTVITWKDPESGAIVLSELSPMPDIISLKDELKLLLALKVRTDEEKDRAIYLIGVILGLD